VQVARELLLLLPSTAQHLHAWAGLNLQGVSMFAAEACDCLQGSLSMLHAARNAPLAVCSPEGWSAAATAALQLLPALVQMNATLQQSAEVPEEHQQAALNLARSLAGTVWQGGAAAMSCEAQQPQPPTSSSAAVSQPNPSAAQL